MGSKFSLGRLKRMMGDGSVPVVNTTINEASISTIEVNAIHNGISTFNGDVYFSGAVYGLTVPIPETASYAITSATASILIGFNQNDYLLTSSFNTFTTTYNTGSFSGSFIGTASYALNSPSFNTASFATTGSNTFIGNQTITGNLSSTTSSIGNVSFTNVFNYSVSSVVTASGTGQSSAQILPGNSSVYLCTSANPARGIKLNTTDAVLGRTFIVINDDASNNNFYLFPPTGGKIDNAAVNNAVTISQGRSAMLICFDATAGSTKWACILGA